LQSGGGLVAGHGWADWHAAGRRTWSAGGVVDLDQGRRPGPHDDLAGRL